MLTKVPQFIIQNIQPGIDGGKYPVKREVGDVFTVTATVFRDGHDVISVILKHREKYTNGQWHESDMKLINQGLDIWEGSFTLEKNDRYEYTIEAYTDIYRSWLHDTEKKLDAAQDIASELMEGKILLGKALKLVANDETWKYCMKKFTD